MSDEQDPSPPRARKFTLAVAGNRVGSLARPAADGATRISPAKRFGLRVNRSPLAGGGAGRRDDDGSAGGTGDAG